MSARDTYLADFYKNALASLMPDPGTTPIINSYGAGTQPVVQFTSGGKNYSFTPAIGRSYEGFNTDANGIQQPVDSYIIEPENFSNWSNESNWGSNVSGLPVMKADWATDLVNNSVYKRGGGATEYTGGGWLSESPIATKTWEAPKDNESWLSQFIQGPGIPLGGFIGAGAIGSGGLGNFFSSFGGGASGAGGVSGGQMFDPLLDFGSDYFSGASDFFGGNLPYSDPIEGLIDLTNKGMSGEQAVQALGQMNPAWTQNTLQFLLNNPSQIGSYINNGFSDLVSGLFGGNGGGNLTRPTGSGGGILGSLASAAPVLAAIDYAKSQGPFDTSRLESLYNQYSPNSAAFSYDQNTNAGRTALQSSLTNRGVMGSSFGNADITNFDTTRELGRNALVSQAAGQMGGIAGNILDAQVKSRALKNDLYGRSLLALGNVFGGRNSPSYSI